MKTIILLGKSGAGKTVTGKKLEKLFGLQKIVTVTTRPIRPGEIDGQDYFFYTEEEFRKAERQELFAETAEFDAVYGHCCYGSLKESYKLGNSYIILTPSGLRTVAKKLPNIFPVYFQEDDEVLRDRLKKRGDNPNEIERRLKADHEDFLGIEKDILRLGGIILRGNETIGEAAEKIFYMAKYGEEVA